MGLGRIRRNQVKRRAIRDAGVWFIDIPRTSTTSIRTELGTRYGEVFAKDAGRLSIPCHETAVTMREFLGAKVWNSLFTFTFTRNPWDRMFSLYCWSKKHGFYEDRSFDAYLDGLLSVHEGKAARDDFHGGFMDNAGYVLDESGQIIVDFVGKYETRTEDVAYIASKLGMPDLGSMALNKQAPSDSSYRDHYSERGREIIAKIHHRDIELFGYEFEGA